MAKRGLSILQKQIILVFTLVVLSVGLYAFYAIHNFREDKLKYIFQTNQILAQSVGRSLKANFQSIKSDSDQIEDVVKNMPASEAATHVIDLLFKRNVNFGALAVIDDAHPSKDPAHPFTLFLASATFVGSHDVDLEKVQMFATQALRAGVDPSAQGQLTFRDHPEQGILSHVARVGTSTVVLLINKDFIASTLAESEGFDLFLVDAQNHVLSTNIRGPVTSMQEHPMLDTTKNMQFESGSRNFQLTKPDGSPEKYVGSFFKVMPGVTLVSQVTEFKASAGLRELALRSIFFALVLAGLGITLGYFFSKSLTAPLLSLMKATEDLAAGNYQIKFNINTRDEVKELSNHFETLAGKLNSREKELEKVTELAIKDGMTGAYNNRHFREKFSEWFLDAKQQGKDLCFAIIDVDHFKKFNDTYGHQQGDEVLKQLVKLLQRTVRPQDFVARYGGEEFVILMPDTPVAEGTQIAESVRTAYEAYDIPNLATRGAILKSTCSIGVVHVKSGNFTAIDQMIEVGDQNLYKCKKGGRNRVIAS
jgi:diguanylate cyclase (GGDEF)-like protein